MPSRASRRRRPESRLAVNDELLVSCSTLNSLQKRATPSVHGVGSRDTSWKATSPPGRTSREYTEVLPHAVVRVVAVDEEKVDARASEQLVDALVCLRLVRIGPHQQRHPLLVTANPRRTSGKGDQRPNGPGGLVSTATRWAEGAAARDQRKKVPPWSSPISRIVCGRCSRTSSKSHWISPRCCEIPSSCSANS